MNDIIYIAKYYNLNFWITHSHTGKRILLMNGFIVFYEQTILTGNLLNKLIRAIVPELGLHIRLR